MIDLGFNDFLLNAHGEKKERQELFRIFFPLCLLYSPSHNSSKEVYKISNTDTIYSYSHCLMFRVISALEPKTLKSKILKLLRHISHSELYSSTLWTFLYAHQVKVNKQNQYQQNVNLLLESKHQMGRRNQGYRVISKISSLYLGRNFKLRCCMESFQIKLFFHSIMSDSRRLSGHVPAITQQVLLLTEVVCHYDLPRTGSLTKLGLEFKASQFQVLFFSMPN